MLLFIMLFTPAVLASLYYSRMKDIPVRSWKFVAFTFVFVFLINLADFGFLFISGHADTLFGTSLLTFGFLTKYGAVSLMSAILFPHLLQISEFLNDAALRFLESRHDKKTE